jgi:crotonobetainyl-CoA:carnitine CoA-transferase CaiB-like acyl-CoA transferase
VCRALDLPQYAGLDNAERNRRVGEVNGAIADVLRDMTAGDALERLVAHDVPAAPVLDRAGMLVHPHFRERGTVVDGGDGRLRSGPLVRFERAPARAPHGAPDLDSGAPTWPPRA